MAFARALTAFCPLLLLLTPVRDEREQLYLRAAERLQKRAAVGEGVEFVLVHELVAQRDEVAQALDQVARERGAALLFRPADLGVQPDVRVVDTAALVMPGAVDRVGCVGREICIEQVLERLGRADDELEIVADRGEVRVVEPGS